MGAQEAQQQMRDRTAPPFVAGCSWEAGETHNPIGVCELVLTQNGACRVENTHQGITREWRAEVCPFTVAWLLEHAEEPPSEEARLRRLRWEVLLRGEHKVPTAEVAAVLESLCSQVSDGELPFANVISPVVLAESPARLEGGGTGPR